ncbi:hypothetical protein ACHAXA_011041 [Cyclostephanos tholiformis]|uniref:PDZ domain-containing protein n=1 Tax=Cyclostephanos tholiformis TaxID=382380 RepID=A0ABD3RYZ2_9STRA
MDDASSHDDVLGGGVVDVATAIDPDAVAADDPSPTTPSVNPLMVCYFDSNDDDDDDDDDEDDEADELGPMNDVVTPPPPHSTVTMTRSDMTMGRTMASRLPPTPNVVEYTITSVDDGVDEYNDSTTTRIATTSTREGSSSSSSPSAVAMVASADRFIASDEIDGGLHDEPDDDDDDDDVDATSAAPLSPDALLEAERQAAIAAAISANYARPPTSASSIHAKMMSPSEAAGVAREMMMASSSSSSYRDDGARRATTTSSTTTFAPAYRTSGPTIVALPPMMPSSIPGPYRMPSSSTSSSSSSSSTSKTPATRRSHAPPQRPVRFDDVRIAFRDRPSSSSSSSSSSSAAIEGVSKDDGGNDVVGGDDGARIMTAYAEGVADLRSMTVGSGGSEEVLGPSSPAVDSGEIAGDDVVGGGDDDAKSKIPSCALPTTIRSANATHDDDHDLMPDSFLKFLLHVARVPLLPEEKSSSVMDDVGRNRHDNVRTTREEEGSDEKTSPLLLAARAASKRAHDILCMVQCSYESTSEAQERISRHAGRTDATESFFAACAGLGVSDADDLGDDLNSMRMIEKMDDGADSPVNGQSNYRDRELFSMGGSRGNPPPPPSSPSLSSSSSTASMTTASSMASSVFSNVISKMIIPKKQSSFTEMGKKLVGGTIASAAEQRPNQPKDVAARQMRGGDYEVLIDDEMLGLTVENVLERTIIRTLLPDGAARRAGAQVGSLVAKVGNIDTSNLTHFETIDELRRSQRPLKLTLRHVGGGVLRKAREEMGRLIRGQGSASAAVGSHDVVNSRPWKGSNTEEQRRTIGPTFPSETFDSVLNNRWPSKFNKSSPVGTGSGGAESTPPLAMTREERMQQAGKKLIRILALLVVGLVKELTSLKDNAKSALEENAEGGCGVMRRSHLSVKELREAIEISSKILLDFVSGFPDLGKDPSRSTSGGGGSSSGASRQEASSFYPVPPGRVQGKKRGPHPPPHAGMGSKSQTVKKHPASSPLLRIGDALKRSRSFLVELSSVTATALRWEIIDYLCMVLDLDTEQELSENEDSSETSNGGDAGSPLTDLGAAGSILKLIVLNCSTIASEGSTLEGVHIMEQSQQGDGESDNSYLAASSGSAASTSTSGNCFISVVHRLAASKSTSARISACSLGPVLWSHIDFPRQLQLRGVLTRALHDVEVVVRKSTAVVLHEIAELVFDRRAVPWLVLMCERSMTDPEPQLRAAAMTLTWHLAEHLPNAFVDNDDLVRSEAVLCIPRLVESVICGTPDSQRSIAVLESLLPLALKIQKDTSSMVRSGTTYMEHKKYVDDILIPILQKLLQDSDPEVTTASLRAVTNASRSGTARETSSTRIPLGSQSPLIDDDLVSLSSHQSHHSHASFERTKPVFIPVLSEKQLCLRLMNDKVDAVRKTAAECFCLGGSSLARHGEEDGGEWMNTIVIPHLRMCSISEDGKQRLLTLKMVEIIITNGLCPTSRSGIEVENIAPQLPLRDDESVSSGFAESVSSGVTECERPVRIILTIAASLTSDKVANVRLNVGRTFAAIVSFLDRPDVEFVIETLEKQLDEESARSGGGDRDVIYFSHQAISMAQLQRQHLRRTSSVISSE